MGVAQKIESFRPKDAYSPRSLEQLNALARRLNDSKTDLSNSLEWYLREYREEYDIPRLCRALAMPNTLALRTMAKKKMIGQKKKTEIPGVDNLIYRIAANLLAPLGNGYISGLGRRQKKAIIDDIGELRTYVSMYARIDLVKNIVPDLYPDGNPFSNIMDIMGMGGAIIRFKYVSRDGSRPEERAVSYHPMNYGKGVLFGVHIEGDHEFSMRKMWGDGDDMLKPIRPEYGDTIIRWGKDDVEAAMTRKEFLYCKEFLY